MTNQKELSMNNTIKCPVCGYEEQGVVDPAVRTFDYECPICHALLHIDVAVEVNYTTTCKENPDGIRVNIKIKDKSLHVFYIADDNEWDRFWNMLQRGEIYDRNGNIINSEEIEMVEIDD